MENLPSGSGASGGNCDEFWVPPDHPRPEEKPSVHSSTESDTSPHPPDPPDPWREIGERTARAPRNGHAHPNEQHLDPLETEIVEFTKVNPTRALSGIAKRFGQPLGDVVELLERVLPDAPQLLRKKSKRNSADATVSPEGGAA